MSQIQNTFFSLSGQLKFLGHMFLVTALLAASLDVYIFMKGRDSSGLQHDGDMSRSECAPSFQEQDGVLTVRDKSGRE